MAKEFGWELGIRDNVMFKTTLNCREVYVLILLGDVVNERLDNILDGGGVFDLEKRVVCDDEWFSGWLVRDIDVNKKYVGSVEHVEFEEPGNSGYFSGECFNKRKNYRDSKNKRNYDIEDEIIKLVESILFSGERKCYNLRECMGDLDWSVRKIHKLIEKMYKNIEKLRNDIKAGDISKMNESLDNLEWNVYKIEDYLKFIKNGCYKSLFEHIINSLANDKEINYEKLNMIKNAECKCLEVNKNLSIAYNFLMAISGVIIRHENLPDNVVRRLNIINVFIEKLCNDILSIKENEGKTLSCVLSKLYNSYVCENKEEKEKLANEIKDMVDSLYFDCYDAFVKSIGEYEFKFVKLLASTSLIYDYAKWLKEDGEKKLFNHIIFKILKNNGFEVKEYDIVDTLLNIRKSLSLFENREVRYFDRELMKIIRGFLQCTKKEEFYENVMRLKEFVEDLRGISQILEKCSNGGNEGNVDEFVDGWGEELFDLG